MIEKPLMSGKMSATRSNGVGSPAAWTARRMSSARLEVVGAHGGGEGGDFGEAGSVAGEDRQGVEPAEPVERFEVLDEAPAPPVGGAGVGLEDGVGGDAGQEVVAREQGAVGGVVEREVADGVAGGDVGVPGPVAGVEGVAVVEEHEPVGVDGVGEVADGVVEPGERVANLFGDAEEGDEVDQAGPVEVAEELGGFGTPGDHDRVAVGGEPAGGTEVVGVAVGDDDLGERRRWCGRGGRDRRR